MKTSTNREEVISKKKEAIRILNNTLEYYLKDGEQQNLKKVQLISKWIKDYSNFLRFEDQFDPTKNIAYKRGDIVKINFGFNLGSELGGVHYAIVIDNENRRSANTIVVIPISSYKENKAVYDRDLFIGSEFYNIFSSRNKRLLEEARKSLNDLTRIMQIIDRKPDNDADVIALLNEFSTKKKDLEKKISIIEKCDKELSLMKEGSVVKVEQIRAISKMRIWDPKNTSGILYGIRLSDSTMDKINAKIKELFVFEKNST